MPRTPSRRPPAVGRVLMTGGKAARVGKCSYCGCREGSLEFENARVKTRRTTGIFQQTFEKKAWRRTHSRVRRKSVAPLPCQNKAWSRAHVKTKLGAAPMSKQSLAPCPCQNRAWRHAHVYATHKRQGVGKNLFIYL